MNNYSFYLSYLDFTVLPVYLLIIWFIANRTKQKYINENPIYKYYVNGLFFKILGGLILGLIYVFHYKGGDILSYFQGARAISSMFIKAPGICFSLLAGNRTDENWSFFDSNTGWPLVDMFRTKPDSFAVSRFSTPFLFISFNSFLTGIAVIDFFIYRFTWKFYTMCCELYPTLWKRLALSILFIPSVAFWGSGYLKDTFTFGAALYFTFNFYMIFVKKQNIRPNIIAMITNAAIMITLKPYVLVALLPATLIWISYNRVKSIQNQTLRIFGTPFLIFTGIGLSMFILSIIGGQLGTYGSVDTIIEKAQATQQDLIRSEQYGEHFFNIGTFSPTLGGILGKAPVAIVAGLFRPFIWEVGNIIMLFSGLENSILLFFTIYIVLRLGPLQTFRHILNEPLLLFSVVFSIVMAFSVGLTAANFGALTRYKIPLLPFYVSTLVILFDKMNKSKAVNTDNL